MSIKRDTSITFITRVGIFLLQGISALLLARILGPEGRGLYALIVTVPHIAAMICNFGLVASTAYFVSKGTIHKQQILTIIYLFPLIVGFLAIILLYFFSKYYVQIFPEVSLPLLQYAIMLIPIIAFFNNGLAFLQGEKRFSAFNAVNFFNPLVFLLFFIIFVIFFDFQLQGAIFSWQIGFILSALLGAYLITQKNTFDFSVKRNDFITLIKYSSRISMSEILTFLNYRMDIFLVGFFLDAKSVGWYTIAVVIAETLWFLANSIANVLFPNFSERKESEAQNLLKKGFSVVFWFTLISVLILIFLDHYIIQIAFGTEFLTSLQALQFLYPGVLLLSLYKILSSYIASRNKPGIIMRIAFIGLIFNFILNVILIPKLGISGAAIASSTAYGLMFFCGLIWFKKNGIIPIHSLFVIKKREISKTISWYLKRVVDFRSSS